jgi:cytochrome P450
VSAPLSAAEGEAPPYPSRRENFVDPATALITGPAISPLKLVGGSTGWLVTRFSEARQLLRDPRFSAERWRGDDTVRPVPQRVREQRGTGPGSFLSLDPPEHGRYRSLLTGHFTVRRMRALEPRIAQIVSDCLDALAQAGQGADLVRHFALPVPSLVICEMLGVPYAERALFQRASARLLRQDLTEATFAEAMGTLTDFIDGLIKARRVSPGDDLISTLTSGSDLSDDEINGVSRLLLIAGHETTTNMLSLGIFTLLQKPEQMRRLREDGALLPGAVEELLRYLSIVNAFPVRIALKDVSFAGVTVKAGQTVAVSIPAANRDPALTEDPGALDVARPRSSHLAFGYGIHQCLGQHLARLELLVGYRELLARFPGLRLAVPPEEIPMRTDMIIYGAHEMPVAW